MNTIVAVSGDQEDYIPFLVPEIDLFSDTLHLIDCATLNKKTPSIRVRKCIKDNEKEIQHLPKEYNTDVKIKKLEVVLFPLILPIVKGYYFEDRFINDKEIYESVNDIHNLYAEWFFLFEKKTSSTLLLQQTK